jgi:two-component system cell cycle sensor histidine kinase/response regulator CckA
MTVGVFLLLLVTQHALLVMLIPGVIVAAYVGGLRAGLLATFTSAGAAAYLINPIAHSGVAEGFDILRLTAFVGVDVAISVLIEALHRARERVEGQRDLIVKSEQRFTRAFFASPVAKSISRIDDRTVVEVNNAYLRTFDVSREDIIGRTPEAAGIIVGPESRAWLFATLRDKGEIRDLEVDFPTQRGISTVLMSSQVIELDGVPHALSNFVDVTARKVAQEEARTSSDRFRQLAEAVNAVFWLTDPRKNQVVYVSPAYEKIWGRSVDELLETPQAWIEAIHPADRDRVREAVATKQRDDGYEEHYRILRPDGSVRWIRDKAFPVRDASGEIIRMAGVAEDMTEQRMLEDQLRQTQKLESLGLFAGGIAHDFNNILGAIAANTDMLADAIPAGSPDRELVDDIEAAVTRASAMTRQLLSFSRKQVCEPVVLDLNRAVEDTRRMLRRMVGDSIVVRVSLDPDARPIRCDPSQLVQVLMNLCVNARDAMRDGGTLMIETWQIGDRVVLAVNDTGCGMTAEVKARVFEPFFTTKEVGRGTGLGLPVVHGIVQQAGGRIEIDSTVGVGTTFRLVFPTVADPVEPMIDLEAVAAHGVERILLVDDDWHLRNAAARGLRTRGYTVLEAGDARSALRLLGEHGKSIDLLITDVVMPGIDGRQLAELARLRVPSLRVLFISGYIEDEIVHHAIQQRTAELVEKPFRVHALAARVRQLLDRAHS